MIYILDLPKQNKDKYSAFFFEILDSSTLETKTDTKFKVLHLLTLLSSDY